MEKSSCILTAKNKALLEELTVLFSFPFNARPFYNIRTKLNAPGIYRIINKQNGIFYLGATFNLMTRFSYHRNHLVINKHDNILLQDDFNFYGISSFEYEIVRVCNSIEEYQQALKDESAILLYCRKINLHIYNLYVKPFNEIKNNNLAKLLNRDRTAQRFGKKWIVTFPSGEVKEIFNLRNFCREKGLNHSRLIETADNKRAEFKGYSCIRAFDNIRKKKQTIYV